MTADGVKPDLKVNKIKHAADLFKDNVGKVIVGKEDAIELIFIALLCEGHILIEDVPGLGKTQLAKATTKSLGCSFKRIQCTPDLLPTDITGIQFFNQKTSDFEFRPGPIMANIIIVDEINRAMPRTQSCLLECMQEQQITVDVESIPLPRPFLIIATQNPIELEGTFPLPEAQLDRFLLRVGLGYPSVDEEDSILTRFKNINPLDSLNKIIDGETLLEFQGICRQIHVDDSLRKYIIEINRSTRDHNDVKLGTSPRSSIGLHMASQALAAVRGRDYIIPDDVKYLSIPVLSHRLILKTDARLRGRTDKQIIKDILSSVPVPTEDIK